jgi:hypothetical protein
MNDPTERLSHRRVSLDKMVNGPFAARFIESAKHQGNVLDFVYWLGLLLRMFLAGAETLQLFTRDKRREVGWLTRFIRKIKCPLVVVTVRNISGIRSTARSSPVNSLRPSNAIQAETDCGSPAASH